MILATERNAPAGTEAVRHYNQANYKRFPAYGKTLMVLRLAGQVPREAVVTFDWDIGRFFPRIVLADAMQVDNLELRFLAGLDVSIVYRDKDANRVLELAQAVLKVNPRILNAFAIEIPKNSIIKNLAGEVML